MPLNVKGFGNIFAMQGMNVARIAPTPSGYIHEGNALNFILTYTLAKHINAKIELRIDDIDLLRVKEQYVDDIFDTLDWLELEWDIGAKNREDFFKNYTFANKRESMFAKIHELKVKYPKLFYSCKCSRKDIQSIYHGNCYDLNLKLECSKTALRMHLKKDAVVKLGKKEINLYDTMGDIVLWTKDGFASYQFASLMSDEESETTLIVRGADLLNSSAIQFFMAETFGFKNFINATFIHHPLILDKSGQKMSKSNGSQGLYSIKKTQKYPHKLFQDTAIMLGIENYQDITSKTKLLLCKKEIDKYIRQKSCKFNRF